MDEIVAIRASEEWMQREFGSSLGEPMPIVPRTGNKSYDDESDRVFPPLTRRIVLSPNDSIFGILKEKILEAEENGAFPYSAVWIKKKYSSSELKLAELFYLKIKAIVDHCGE